MYPPCSAEGELEAFCLNSSLMLDLRTLPPVPRYVPDPRAGGSRISLLFDAQRRALPGERPGPNLMSGVEVAAPLARYGPDSLSISTFISRIFSSVRRPGAIAATPRICEVRREARPKQRLVERVRLPPCATPHYHSPVKHKLGYLPRRTAESLQCRTRLAGLRR